MNPRKRAREESCPGTATQTRTIACTLQTHVVVVIHVSALLDQIRHQLDHALLSRIKERMLGPVLAQRCLDLVVLGTVEGSFPALKRAGVSAGAWRARACMCGPSPSLALPRRTLLPRHSNTDAHDCVHTSPCIPWRAHTWHAGTRAHSAMPTPAARPRHLPRPSPRRRRRAVAASVPPQHARARRHSASSSSRAGEQACGQRRGHSDKSGLGRRRRSPAQGTLHSGHAPAQAHCNRGSHDIYIFTNIRNI